MDRTQYLITRNRTSSFYSYLPLKSELLLPAPTIATGSSEKPTRIRVRTILGHCLYRRVVLWTLSVLFLLSITFFKAASVNGKGRKLGRPGPLGLAAENDEDRPRLFGDAAKEEKKEEEDNSLPWLKYPQ